MIATCKRCGGQMLPDEPGEWACCQCGNRFYGASFKPLDLPPNPRDGHYDRPVGRGSEYPQRGRVSPRFGGRG